MQSNTLKVVSNTKAMTAILSLSAVIFAFLIWLIYYKERIAYSSDIIASLPAFNALFNTMSTLFLTMGYINIRRGNRKTHEKFMWSALGSSTLFLISYIVYHAFHGDTKFPGTGIVRPIYFFILISHITLSAVAVPLILTSFYLSLSQRFKLHKKVSRFTFPIWLYVSVTGVLIFLFLKAYTG